MEEVRNRRFSSLYVILYDAMTETAIGASEALIQ